MRKSTYPIILAVLFLGACSSSKFNYKEAYKFSHYDYNKKINHDQVSETKEHVEVDVAQESLIKENNESLTVSTSDNQPQTADPEVSLQRLAEKVETYKEAQKNPGVRLNKEEKKALKKEIKNDFKEVKQELKKLQKEDDDRDVSMNQKVYIGIIIAVAGLVIAILASSGLGALAIIVGVALIAWGLIEQGAL